MSCGCQQLVTPTYSPCANNYYQYGTDKYNLQTRGVTTWNLDNQYTIPNNALLYPKDDASGRDRATIVFTNTQPKCWSGKDTSNLVFNAWRTGAGTTAATIAMTFTFNGVSYMNSLCLSGVATHGATQAFEFAGVCNPAPYYDPGENTLIFYNDSSSTIQLDHLKLYRTYKMCNTNCVNHEYPYECTCPICGGGSLICSGGVVYGTSGSFDATRIDTPCNSFSCGGLSYTQWHDMTHAGALLQPGSILSWTINFTNCNYNWQGKSICLINFNNVWPTSTSPYADNELALILTVNGTEHTVNNYYLSKYANQPISPNYDLAQSNYYNDTGANTVSLKNLGASPITVSPGEYGGIDVYRIYQSTPICDSECTVGCEVSCQSCNTCCDVCESCESCQVACESCLDSCYLCYTVYCCQMCYGPCVSCVECQACETPCDTACQPCQVCQPCEMCQPCETCQSPCQIICDNCQTCVDCQASVCCQSCIVPWYGGCQECETCQPAYS